MNARMILGALGAVVVTASVVSAGALIWVVTAEPERLAAGETPWALPGLVLSAVTRVLSLVL
jgi:hypothetical protein